MARVHERLLNHCFELARRIDSIDSIRADDDLKRTLAPPSALASFELAPSCPLSARQTPPPRSPIASMVSRDLNAAKDAFSNADVAASRAAHDAHGEAGHAGEAGKYVKSLVFGGLDGTITTFAVVAASKGGSLSANVVLLMGFANLVADGLSMGFGDYLSSKAELSTAKTEKKREKWELENYPEGEKKEMIELYMARGVSEDDATLVIETLAKYKNFFLDLMMVEEPGSCPLTKQTLR